ncbi:hypothetical protein I79_001308 [Cricetulus griseus]|uniref:Uncharacterized protein n=1 Tax=Cricetulus griseus TaxID=10029 RepID=G3GUE9_CRIGR|nr:hypothetical protein I79_001308 [Cricetulus griseus]
MFAQATLQYHCMPPPSGNNSNPNLSESALLSFLGGDYKRRSRAREFHELASPPSELEQKLELGSESKLKGSRRIRTPQDVTHPQGGSKASKPSPLLKTKTTCRQGFKTIACFLPSILCATG